MDLPQILLFVVLFLLSWFFSGTEIALMSLPKHKIDSLLKSKKAWARALRDIKEDTDSLLIMILIWNNLVNVYTAALATQIAIEIAKTANLWIDQAQAVWISTWIVTLFLLLFWEIIPKSFASKNAQLISLLVAPLYKFLITIFFPIIIIIKLVIKIFSGKKAVENITDDEIKSFLDMWRAHWWIDDNEHQKIRSIFEFSDTIAEEIMTPRVRIEAISIDTTISEAVKFYLNHTHSRIPIYNGTIDKIDYFISARDLLKEFSLWNWEKKLSQLKLKKVLKVPLNQPISKLLDIFQKTNKIFAIIMDQYGWVAWLVSLEDVIEQVFWEIRDESDREIDEFTKTEDGRIISDSFFLMQDLLYEHDLELSSIWLDEKEFNGETISFVITHVLWTFPVVWEEISFDIISQDDEDENMQKKLILKTLEVLEEVTIWKVESRIETIEKE